MSHVDRHRRRTGGFRRFLRPRRRRRRDAASRPLSLGDPAPLLLLLDARLTGLSAARAMLDLLVAVVRRAGPELLHGRMLLLSAPPERLARLASVCAGLAWLDDRGELRAVALLPRPRWPAMVHRLARGG